MFIIAQNRSARKSLELIWNELSKVNSNFSSIEEYAFGDYYLFWFSAKPQDQLSVYKNGFIIGKTSFEEEYVPHSIDKTNQNLPKDIHPFLQLTKIQITDNEIEITPNGCTSIFYSNQNSVSDHQLLIAKHEQLNPSSILVQIFCGIGYIPGNLSLFENIHKIPYLFALNLAKLKISQVEIFGPVPSNDSQLVNRLTELIPDCKNVSLAISGGMDSRFVLGLLLKKGIQPNLVTLKGNELSIVEELSKALNLNLEVHKHEMISAYTYTLMTDGRIYFRGGNYSQMINKFKSNELLYHGLSILPINENSFASAWKKPGRLETIYEDLIDYALIPRVPINGFQSFQDPRAKSTIKAFLLEALDFGKKYYNFKTRKQWGAWFYHLHRGLTWTPSHLADLSFFIYPVFNLFDKKASEIGISSTAYENFNKERLRRMNQRLFAKTRIDYSDNRKFESESAFTMPFSKIYNEFFCKFFKRFQNLKKDPSEENTSWFNDVNDFQASSFRAYFKMDLSSLLSSKETRFNEKRVAVTLNNVLLFLEK